MKKYISTGVIVYRILNGQLEYLLLHYLAGHWDFPKGKMEPGETYQETALRELYEEAGISAHIQPDFQESFTYTFHDYDGAMATKTVHWFLGEAISDEIILSSEHTNSVWLPYQETYDKLTHTNAKLLLKKATVFLGAIVV